MDERRHTPIIEILKKKKARYLTEVTDLGLEIIHSEVACPSFVNPHSV
jgi:hypothetical protein